MKTILHTEHDQIGFTLIELMIVVAILGIVAAIAVPNFLRYQQLTRQAEARTNLGATYVAEMAFFSEAGRFSDFSDVGFTLAAATNRYTYRSQKTTQVGSSVTPGAIQVIGPAAGVPQIDNSVAPAGSTQGSFTATAVANLDNDLTLDMWHVNDRKENLLAADTNDVGY